LTIGADARVLGATLHAGDAVDYQLAEGSRAYLVVARGMVEINGTRLAERDGGAIEDERALHLVALEDAEIILVETR
jgi:quercetin 2,3-dioxygenase